MRFSLAIVLLAAAPVSADECVSDGTHVTMTHDRPALPESSDPEQPKSWTTEDVQMKEADPISDDPMGPAGKTDTTDPASSTVTNSGGDLFGPRGGDQNGGTEGDCIEVMFCWTARLWIPAKLIVFLEEYVWIQGHYETEEVCSDPEQVCPEGSCP